MADSMEELQLSINQDFATKLRKQKEKAELDQLKQKFGDEAVDAEPESSSSESEDEDARELTSQKEKDFLKVLSMLKNKDPEIYEKESSFYHDDEKSSSEEERQESLKAQKPMYLKDYERKELLQRGSLAFISDEESEEESNEDKTEDVQDKGSPSYVEEQKLIKESFKEALEENDNEEEDFLKVREKSTEEKLQEDREYIDWLKGERSKLEKKPATQMEALRHYWMDPQLDEDEQFLRDYILDRNYIEKDSERIPTYAEIVGDDEEDEEEVEKQEEFERKFNFRFEEPDADFIKTYPRTVQGSVRKTDERRKEQRKSRESKKEKEKEQKREELKRLKNLKRKEIMEKLEKLKEITGNPNVGFREEDIEGDFDPKKYDEAMKNVFDEQFYEGDDGKKPVFEDDLNDEENWDEWEGEYGEHVDNEQQQTNGNYEPHYEDPDFNMDADFEENANNQNMEGFSEKKRKRGSRFALALAQKKPVFDPDEKTFEEYFDEYYKLDYEDVIGDTPCRFKYRQVAPNNFGLSTEEILACTDKELNQWVSVKKMSQYRSNSDEFKDLKKYRKRGQDEKTKKQILTSLQEKESAQEDNGKRKSSGGRASDNMPLAKKTRESSIPNETISVESELEALQNKPETVSTNITETTCSKIDSKREENEENQKAVVSQEHRRSRFNQELQRRKAKQSNPKRKRLTFKELKEQAIKKRLQRQFRGAKKEQLNKLSAGRLASYGVLKKKKKKKTIV